MDNLHWHYTSLSVLQSILGGKVPTLRATNVLYLNDYSELKHGLKVIIDELNKDENIRLNASVQQDFETILNPLFDPELYSFSLSHAENSLYQWLAYCPKDGGVSLGFDFSEPFDIDNGNCVWLPLPKPTENQDIQTPRVRECLYLDENEELPPDWFIQYAEQDDITKMFTNAMFIKHKSFDFEQEYRLFFHPMPSNPFEIPIKMIGKKPYIEFHFLPKMLKKIYISPRGDRWETYRAVKKYLSLINRSDIEVELSLIPFRET